MRKYPCEQKALVIWKQYYRNIIIKYIYANNNNKTNKIIKI